MTDIFKGIVSLWNADATLKAALPRFYNTIAPEQSTLPYCVFTLVASAPDYTFERSYEHPIFQFAVYDDVKTGAATINTIHGLMCDCFDDGILTAGSYRYKMVRRSDRLSIDESGEAYQFIIEYEIMKSV